MNCTIAFALLLALAAPSYAGGLVEKVFQQKIADDWYDHFKRWTATSVEGDKFIDTYFVVAGAPVPHRVNGIENGMLIARQLRIEGAQRSPVGEPARFEWKDWLPKYIAGVYPVANNGDDRDLIAFAIWLYLNADDALLGNRILTAVYERNESLRQDVGEYVRERHGYKPKDKLEVTEVWDAEFARWRRVLLNDKDSNAFRKEREKAEGTITDLLSEYANRDKRSMTLDQIDYAIRQWVTKFEDSRTHKKEEQRIARTLGAIRQDCEKIKVLMDLASPRENDDIDWDKTGADYEKALELDPCSPLLLSKAANAWMKHGNPEYLRNEWKCTHESSIRKARDLYYRWLGREPKHKTVMEQLVVCHEVLGERNDANKLRTEIENLD